MRKSIGLIGTLLMLTLPLSDAGLARTRSRTVTHQGGTLTQVRQRQATGNGSYSQSGSFNLTDKEGGSRSGTFSGQGQIERTPGQGISNISSGEISTDQGRIFNVNRSATTSRTESGLSRSADLSVRNEAGEEIRSASSTSTLENQQLTHTTDLTIPRGSYQVNSIVTSQGDQTLQRRTSVSTSSGETVAGSTVDIGIDFTPGEGWVKTVTGSTDKGHPIERTVVNVPVLESY
jgi:hypothetical protein